MYQVLFCSGILDQACSVVLFELFEHLNDKNNACLDYTFIQISFLFREEISHIIMPVLYTDWIVY